MTPERLHELRRHFPAVQECTYLSHAANGPCPDTGVSAVSDFVQRCARFGEVPYEECEAAAEETLSLLAKLMNVTPAEVVLTSNTTAGILIAIGSIDWRSGDNVVLLEDGFPANTCPYQLMLPEVEKRAVTDAAVVADPQNLLRLVDARTRAVTVDWVHFLSGARVDIRAIARYCRERDVIFIIDAAQGLGATDEDFAAVDADFVCAPANKWLHGIQGLGVLYVNLRRLPRMGPVNLGWLSARWREFNDILSPKPLKTTADRFAPGTRNNPGIFALRASLRIMVELGMAEVDAQVRRLNQRLRAGWERAGWEIITPAAPGRCAGILTARCPGTDMAALHHRLADERIIVALRENHLRVSPHFYNTEQEIDRLLTALEAD